MNNSNFDYEKFFNFNVYNQSWTDAQKHQYFLEKRNEKYQIYIALLVIVSCLLGGILFVDFLISIAFLVLLVLGGQIIEFRKKYFSFRDIEEDEKFR